MNLKLRSLLNSDSRLQNARPMMEGVAEIGEYWNCRITWKRNLVQGVLDRKVKTVEDNHWRI